MNRPVGVTILAILCFIGTALCVIGGIGVMAGGGFIANLINQSGGQGSAGAAGLLAGLGAAVGVIILIFGAVYALVGWGLWKLKEWARIVTIVLVAIGALFQALGVFGSLLHFNIFGILWAGFWLAVDVLIIWYLLKPEVKAAFQGAQVTAASA